MFLNVCVTLLPCVGSDHCPIMLNAGATEPMRMRPFKFEKFWRGHCLGFFLVQRGVLFSNLVHLNKASSPEWMMIWRSGIGVLWMTLRMFDELEGRIDGIQRKTWLGYTMDTKQTWAHVSLSAIMWPRAFRCVGERSYVPVQWLV